MQIAQLLRLNRARRIGHQAGAFGRFRESDHVPDARRVAERRDEPVEAQRDAAVRRGAVFERFQHITEARLHHVRRNLQHLLEHRFLHVGPMMEVDALAMSVVAVAPCGHHVVRFRAVLAVLVWTSATSWTHCQVRDDPLVSVKVNALVVPGEGMLPVPVHPVHRHRMPFVGGVLAGAEARKVFPEG